MTLPDKPPRTPRFESGTKVRVRPGVIDPNYDDIPLGGWTGITSASEVYEDQFVHEITWDRRTRNAMHPVILDRCERDGIVPDVCFLAEHDLEIDDGVLAPIEQPQIIVPRPLQKSDQDDRVRQVFGLTHDDPLPSISFESLDIYHRYLDTQLKFPITAKGEEEDVGPYSKRRMKLRILRLLPPEPDGQDLDDGLLGVARVGEIERVVFLAEVEISKQNKKNLRLITDYAHWFANSPFVDDEIDFENASWMIPDQFRPTPFRVWFSSFLLIGFATSLVGATIGSAWKTWDGARLATLIGGVPLGLIGMIILGWVGNRFDRVNRLRVGLPIGLIMGALVGGSAGALVGLGVLAFSWSLLGCIAGLLFGHYVLPTAWRGSTSWRWALLGAIGGILISIFRTDQAPATSGAIIGGIAGFLITVALASLLIGLNLLVPVVIIPDDLIDDPRENREFDPEEPFRPS